MENRIEFLKEQKLTDLITKLIDIWKLWMYNVNRSMDKTLSISDRVISAKLCEELISIRYQILEEIDERFETYQQSRKQN